MDSGPLTGIRVLEFSQIIAGPLGCQLLSDLGADVIKVEPPQGEPWRLSAPFLPLESKTFQSLNRGTGANKTRGARDNQVSRPARCVDTRRYHGPVRVLVPVARDELKKL